MTSLTVEIPQTLIDQQTELTATLATIATEQAKLTTQQTEVETSLRRIDQAVRFLRGEVVIPVVGTAGRKPMSAEARENIRQGLLASAARKKAASAVPQVAAPAVEPAPVPDSPAKAVGGKKAAKA